MGVHSIAAVLDVIGPLYCTTVVIYFTVCSWCRAPSNQSCAMVCSNASIMRESTGEHFDCTECFPVPPASYNCSTSFDCCSVKALPH